MQVYFRIIIKILLHNFYLSLIIKEVIYIHLHFLFFFHDNGMDVGWFIYCCNFMIIFLYLASLNIAENYIFSYITLSTLMQ